MQTAPAGRVGPKQPVSAQHAVCAAQHPIVTDTVIDVMRGGGNAIDAAVAGCLVQATVQQDMTDHAGTISLLYWDAASGRMHELNSWGTIVPGLAPFRPVPAEKASLGYSGLGAAFAVIPGFMPGLQAMYERFGSRPWSQLCEPAIRWAEEGHEVNSFEHQALVENATRLLYSESGRAHFAPSGHLPQVGDRWPKPELARTLRALAAEGPDHFVHGGWARAFVQRANDMGWDIELRHMSAIPPRWQQGRRYRHGEHEIVQLSPPEVAAVTCALVLGILRELDVTSLGHYTESAEALYYLGHTLRRARLEMGLVNDPEIFEDPAELLMSPSLHAYLAEVIRRSRPKVDLRRHVELIAGRPAMRAAGMTDPGAGSCELSLVDPQGNWVQMINTCQGGGIPGEVVGGVSMMGCTAGTSLASGIGGWFAGGGRMRGIVGNTFVLKDGQPVWSLGTPGFPIWTVPQVLLNRLDYGMGPYEAEEAPRAFPLTDDYRLPIESRISSAVVDDLARLGVLVDPLVGYDYHMGSFQMSWRGEDGLLHSSAGPRRAGSAAGF